METNKIVKAEILIKYFGYRVTSKALKISESTLRKYVKSPRSKDVRLVRKRRELNPDLKPSHTLDFCTIAKKSIFEANKHNRKNWGNKLNPDHYTLGIIFNLRTEKLIWKIWNCKTEKGFMTEELIIKAKEEKEEITVLRVDNQNKINAVKRHNIKPQIINKVKQCYNSHAERNLGRFQKTIERIVKEHGKKFVLSFDLFKFFNSIAEMVYNNNPDQFLEIIESQKIQKYRIEVTQIKEMKVRI